MRFSSLAVVLVLTPMILGQPVPSREPTSTHIFPAGGRRGTTVPVRVGMECAPPGCSFQIVGEGVVAPTKLGQRNEGTFEASPRRVPTEVPISYPKEWGSTIRIADDATPGVRWWRVSCARGGTALRPFVVGDLPEVIESEPNSSRDKAERIRLPVTVNGQIAGERDMDWYVFSAHVGEVISCEMFAGRIGSPLDPVIEIRDRSGRVQKVQSTRVGSDVVLAFRVATAGDYFLHVANVGLRSGPAHVYRMTLTTKRKPLFAYPPAGRAGERGTVRYFGLDGAGGWRSWDETVTFSNAGLIREEDRTTRTEAEPNDVRSKATRLEMPMTMYGQLESARDEDWYRFSTMKGQRYSIDCGSACGASPSLPLVSVFDSTGKQLTESRSIEATDRRCRLEWQAPEKGVFYLRVRDLQHGVKGGPEFVYRLGLIRDQPGFSLTVVQNCINVQPEGAFSIEVTARRHCGFAGAIDLRIDNLPTNIEAESMTIPKGKTSVKVTLKAGKDVRPGDALLRVVGRARVGSKTLERIATIPHLGIDAERASIGPVRIEWLPITVQHKPVFRLFCAEAYQYAHRGSIYPYEMEVERLGGFEGPITLQLGDRQNRDLDGFDVLEIVVPPKVTRVPVPCYLPETMHVNVQSQSQVYVQGYAHFTDRWGEKQSTLVVSEKRVMVRTLPPVAKLESERQTLEAQPGTNVEVELRLVRTAFDGALTVRLLDPPKGVSAEEVRIEEKRNSVRVKIRVGLEVVSGMTYVLRFQAKGAMASGSTVVTGTTASLRVEK